MDDATQHPAPVVSQYNRSCERQRVVGLDRGRCRLVGSDQGPALSLTGARLCHQCSGPINSFQYLHAEPIRLVRIFLLAATLALPFQSFAQSHLEVLSAPSAPERVAPAAPAAELSVADAIILGVIEGVTEFLPLSSTGHLIIATRLLHLESETPLVGSDGQPLWHKKPAAKNPQGEPLTLKLAADTYTVVIQFGAIAAVALLYWSQFMAMLRGLIGRDAGGLRLIINLLIAFIPAAAIGFLAHDWIDDHL